jgi:hypothetical protein
MAKEYAEDEENIEEFEDKPAELRDNDEINDAEEAFMEGYEEDAEEEEEEKEEVEEELK